MTNSQPRRAPRQILFRSLAVILPLVAGFLVLGWLLFLQGWLRWSDGSLSLQRPPLYLQEPGYELTGHRYLYDATLGWRNIPNWSATTFGKPLTINDKGLRDRDYPYQKPPNKKRILILGDSYAWGYGVGDDQRFSDVLETRLRDREPAWEIINTGVSGWGTDQEYLFLTAEGLRYEPDIVVLAFFIGNDIDNNTAATQYTLHKPVFLDADLTPGNLPVPRPGETVAPAVLKQVARLDGIDLTVRILAAIRDACRQRGCEFVVMKFGIFLAPELPYAKLLERSFVQRKDTLQPPLPYLDLDRVFREKSLSAETLTAGVDDGHWNATGHRHVAIALQQFLVAEGLIPPASIKSVEEKTGPEEAGPP